VRFDDEERRTCEEQYVEKCNGGSRNLHLFKLGNYLESNGGYIKRYAKKCAYFLWTSWTI